MITWCKYPDIWYEVMARVIRADMVIDIGCGIRVQPFFKPKMHICVEPFKPYIDLLQQVRGMNDRYHYINMTWDKIMPQWPDKVTDSIFALDFIEHIPKRDGERFLLECERLARKQVVISTPIGLYPRDYDPEKPGPWGMENTPYQAHVCGWEVEDFGYGWDLLCCKDFHVADLDNIGVQLEKPIGGMFAIRNLDSNKAGISSRLHAETKRVKDQAIIRAGKIKHKLYHLDST
jgi:hypothetical protein